MTADVGRCKPSVLGVFVRDQPEDGRRAVGGENGLAQLRRGQGGRGAGKPGADFAEHARLVRRLEVRKDQILAQELGDAHRLTFYLTSRPESAAGAGAPRSRRSPLPER